MTLYALPILAVTLCIIFATFVVAALREDGTPAETGAAVFAVLAQATGVVLMSIGGLPVITAIIGRNGLLAGAYASLLVIFIAGLALYLYQGRKISALGKVAHLPAAMVRTIWRVAGMIAVTAGCLSLASGSLLTGPRAFMVSLSLHLTIILYGIVLLWSTAPGKAKKKKGWFWRKKGKKK